MVAFGDAITKPKWFFLREINRGMRLVGIPVCIVMWHDDVFAVFWCRDMLAIEGESKGAQSTACAAPRFCSDCAPLECVAHRARARP